VSLFFSINIADNFKQSAGYQSYKSMPIDNNINSTKSKIAVVFKFGQFKKKTLM
jgi:hypothetical protein